MAAPYDTVTTVLNAVRARLSDPKLKALESISAKLLDKSQAASQQLTNNAYRKMQEVLANNEFLQLKGEAVMLNLLPNTSTDPASRARLDWDGYFDGVTQRTTPVLPSDLMAPLTMAQRQYNTKQPFGSPLEPILDGLPDFTRQTVNQGWEWRGNAIYLPGASYAVDVRLRYLRYLPDFVDVAANPGTHQIVGAWFDQPVPILRCVDAFADYVCREVSIAANDLAGATAFQTSGEMNCRIILNRDTAYKQRVNVRRQSRSGRLENRGGYGGVQ